MNRMAASSKGKYISGAGGKHPLGDNHAWDHPFRDERQGGIAGALP